MVDIGGGEIEGKRVEIFLINLILGGVYCCIDDGFVGGAGRSLNGRIQVTLIPREHAGSQHGVQ